MTKLTHLNDAGEARMVDIGAKDHTDRLAVARGCITMLPATLQAIADGGNKKGDVLAAARIAAIMAAKKTAELIPLCHPIALTGVDVELDLRKDLPGIECRVSVRCTGPTGVEMEALTAVQVALLTIYDMCKAMDRGMTMGDIQLLEKSGGKSGDWVRE